jgi:hypothetical protein
VIAPKSRINLVLRPDVAAAVKEAAAERARAGLYERPPLSAVIQDVLAEWAGRRGAR